MHFSWETPFLAWLTGLQNAALNAVADVLTFAGTETFMLILVPILYWAVSRRTGVRLYYLLMATLFVNFVLKDSVGALRPVGTEGIQSRDVESAMADGAYPNDSFPSGHAQIAMTIFGYLAVVLRRRAAWIIAVLLTLLVAASRLYNGLHWPMDVIAGILIGAILLLVSVKLMPYIEGRPLVLQGTALAVSAGLFAVCVPGSVGLELAGALLGGGIGHLWEAKAVRSDPAKGTTVRKLVAIGIGLAGMLAIKAGVKAALPEHAAWGDLLRYALIGLWCFAGAPAVFVRLSLVPRAPYASVPGPDGRAPTV